MRGAGRTIGRRIAWLLLLWSWAAPSEAQRLLVRTYTEGDGLPSSAVRDVTQTRDGLMWFATRTGIASYDGTRWRAYGQVDGLTTLSQSALAAGPDGGLWSLAEREPLRVFRFADDSWTAIHGPQLVGLSAPNCIEAMERGGRPFVAVGTSNGLYLWDGLWRRLGVEDGLPGTDVRALQSVGERLLIGTTEGLAALAGGTLTDLSEELGDLSPAGVYGMAVSPLDGSVWLAGEAWIGKLDSTDRFALEARIEHPLVVDYFGPGFALDADAHGGVYYGNPSILRYYHPSEGFTLMDPTSGMLTSGATDAFIDREGNTWISGLRGVSKIVSRRFVTLRQEHGLLEDEVTAIVERPDGSFVLGHPTGVSILDGETIRHLRFDFHREDRDTWVRVLDLDVDRDGRVWVAASHRGLARIDTDGSIEWLDDKEVPTGFVTSVRVDDGGRLWVAINGKGLFIREGGTFVSVYPAVEPNLRRLLRADSGGLYVATSFQGFGRIEEGRFAGLVEGSTSEENNVFAVLDHPEGITYVGTEAGLRVIDGDRIVPPQDVRLQIGRPVYSLTLDDAGRMWVGTDNGVIRWDGSELRCYGVEQGLSGRETNRAAQLSDSRGRVWIGTTNGVSIYREAWDRTRPVRPLVSVETLLAGGERRPLASDVRLGARDHDLTFEVRALSYTDEDRVQVRSRLEGLEEEWTVATGPSRRELRYPHLPAGRYRLHVEARSIDGARSAVFSSPWITIAPPFFRQPAVLILGAAFALLLLSFAHRYLGQRRYARELESEVARRTEQIRRVEEELTRSRRLESLASFAGGVAHDFNNLLSVILGQLALLRRRIDDTTPIDRATDAVDQATKLTGQFLTFARGGMPVRAVIGLEPILREAASLVLAGTNVRTEFAIDENLPCVEVDPGQMAQVFNNLLLNAVQSMPEGGCIRISATGVDQAPSPLAARPAVRVSIEDQGPGIPDEIREHVFEPFFTTKALGQGLGLASAYSIVNRHGGLLEIGNTEDAGACLQVTLLATGEQPRKERPVEAEPVHGTGRILVMDDDDNVRAVLELMLADAGYSTCSTVDGEEAVQRYSEAMKAGLPFHAVILDLTVRGGMGGAEALTHLRDLDPGVRAIVVSGYSEDPVMAEHRRYGFRAAIAKPFTPDRLARVLGRVLGPTSTLRST